MLNYLASRRGMDPAKPFVYCLTRPQLLWTDPQEPPGRGPSKRVRGSWFPVTRCLSMLQGVGIAFGPDVTKRWCDLNGVTGIIRSHEVRESM